MIAVQVLTCVHQRHPSHQFVGSAEEGGTYFRGSTGLHVLTGTMGTTKFEHRVSNRPYVRTAVRKGGKLLDENVQENELESVRICSIVMMDISLSSYLRIGYG